MTVTVHPLLALDMVIDVMVRLHRVTSVKACLNVMVSWLNGQDTDTNVSNLHTKSDLHYLVLVSQSVINNLGFPLLKSC